MEVVASLSQGRTAAAQCGLFTYKSVPVIFEPPCSWHSLNVICSEFLREGYFYVLKSFCIVSNLLYCRRVECCFTYILYTSYYFVFLRRDINA